MPLNLKFISVFLFYFSEMKSMMIDGIPKASMTDQNVFFEKQEDSPEVKHPSVIN